jgi:hypothetical protein
MLQRYKIRLGDGTVLTADLDGLRAWLTDGRATVQVSGTQEWRPLRQVLADEESAARLARALVPPEPRRAPAPSPAEVPPPSPPAEVSIGAPPLVQTLAEETAASGVPVPPWRDSPEAAEEAPIRLKPLDAEPPRRAVPWARSDDDDGEEEEDQDQRHDRLEGPLLQVISTFGNLLSRCLDPLAPLVRGWLSTSADEPAPRLAARAFQSLPRKPPPAAAPPPQVRVLAEDPGGPTAESQAAVDELPVIPLKPLEDGGRPGSPAWEGLSEKITGWVAGVTAWFGRRAGRDRPEPAPPSEPAPKKAPAPAPRAPLAAPPPISELPVLRLAEEVHEPREPQDVYEGEDEEGESALPVLWLWTKRVVAAGVFVGGGVLIGLNWTTWFPRAAEVGETVFTEIDRQARSGERARELEQALRDATERLPHLAPETIRLVLSTTSSGVLDPPEVFQLASEAADRGRSALTAAEATELGALQRELLSGLRPPQRRRLEEYERARATRGVFPFENPYALDLVARGARAMPAASRERLQALLGKAVAAGLGAPAASP